MARAALLALVLLGAIAGAASARDLLAPTPTQQLAAQKAAQAAQQQQQQAAQRAANGNRLPPPCFIPTSYYPLATCGVSTDPRVCARGFNAWRSMAECCAKQRGALGAFPSGCTDLSKERTCYVTGSFHPTRTCMKTNDMSLCVRNWGQWATENACCAPGAAFAEGCSAPEPCYIASAFWPARQCGKTEDQAICQRGWGAFDSEQECCTEGAAFSDGCGVVAGAEIVLPKPEAVEAAPAGSTEAAEAAAVIESSVATPAA